MLTVTGKIGSMESKTFGEDNKSVVNGTFNIFTGWEKKKNPDDPKEPLIAKPDIPIKFSAFGEQADYISKNCKEGDFIRMVANPKLNTYPSKDDPSKTSQYVSYTVKAVLSQEQAKDLYASINSTCKSANEKNLAKAPDGPQKPAPAKAPKAPAMA